MFPIHFIRAIETNEHKEIISVVLESQLDKSIKNWKLAEELMDYTMENDLKIESDIIADILVYTGKGHNDTIIFKMKAFYKGNQMNLLEDTEYLSQNNILLTSC